MVYELLDEARRLAADLREEVSCVFLVRNAIEDPRGPEAAALEALKACGADRIYVVENNVFARLQDEPCAAALAGLASRYRPSILLVGATALGRSLAPRVAARLDTGLTAECVELEIDGESRLLIQTRPAFGANVMASITCPVRRPQMATIRPGILKAKGQAGLARAGLNGTESGQVIKVDMNITEPLVRLIEHVNETCGGENLADAGIIVAGGRGVGSAENFALIRELACALGGAVGATRPVVDAGWAPESSLIGQTGHVVSPKLYIACGISGAIQHMVGISSADIIVAINRDASAPIFRYATYGIVGDVMQVVPALLDALKEGA